MDKSDRTLAFEDVLEDELKAIDIRRESIHKEHKAKAGVSAGDEALDDGLRPPVEHESSEPDEYQRLAAIRRKALREHLVGLSLSGGGIRSATFAVGIIQGLAKLGLIKRIDYLSTVSGGGYAGSWLAAWIRREGSVSNVEDQLAQGRIVNARAEREFLTDADVVDEEPEPIYHLRAYSRYLAPRAGLLTADSWSVVATYVRNISINLMMLLPAAMIIVLLVRSLNNLFNLAVPSSFYDQNNWFLLIPLLLIGGTFLVRGLITNDRAIEDLRNPAAANAPVNKEKMLDEIVLPLLIASVLLPLSLMSISWWLWPEEDRYARHGRLNEHNFFRWFWLPGSPLWTNLRRPEFLPEVVLSVVLACTAVAGWFIGLKRWTMFVFAVLIPLILTLLSHLTRGPLAPGPDPAKSPTILYVPAFSAVFTVGLVLAYIAKGWGDRARQSWVLLRTAVGTGIAGGILLAANVQILYIYCSSRPDLLATLAPPACLLSLVASINVHVALLGHSMNEDEREWWAYLNAHLLIVALGWLAIFGTIIYLPALLYMLPVYVKSPSLQTGIWASLISSWLGTTFAGILAGKSRQTGSGHGNVSLETVATIAPLVFLIGLFALLSMSFELLRPALETGLSDLLRMIFGPPRTAPQSLSIDIHPNYFDRINGAKLVPIVSSAVVLAFVFKFVSRFVDVNLFSLNAMYANRLVRCYLGASRRMPRWERRWGRGRDRREGGGAPTHVGSGPSDFREPDRRPNPVTGFDAKDDLPLSTFRIGNVFHGKEYRGPQLLINTSLNLIDTEELAWADRKSESFVLSPTHCGSKGTGYARVVPEMVDKDLTIGRAIAISGAAVDPNMNYHQSPALTAFLTIFNARLGYWIENPRPSERPDVLRARNPYESPEPWKGKSPHYGMLLISELFGSTDNRGEYVHLSDGGHFENTGVYELIRRRCRYVIACDATTDRGAADGNLSNLIRLARIDLGIRIEIDTSPLQLDGDASRLCRSHVVIGSIRYDDVDNGQSPGVLVYIRASMTGDEPPDVRNYAAVNRAFPYTTTGNQFFDESQFESYRVLGDHVARVVFEDAKADAERTEKLWAEPDYDTEFRLGNNRLFAAIRRRWAESIPIRDQRFLESTKSYSAIQQALREDPTLRDLTHQVYPELPNGADGEPGPGHAPVSATKSRVVDADGRRVELLAVAQMLQAIENAWLGLDLKSHPDELISHGWWSVFRRWTATDAFHRNWPTLRPEFSTEFSRFVESRLGLTPSMPEILPWSEGHISKAEQESLIAEFDREWPNTITDRAHGAKDESDEATDVGGTLRLGLQGMIDRAVDAPGPGNAKGKAVWGILQEPRPRATVEPKVGDCRGIIVVFKGPSVHPAKGEKDDPENELLVWIRRSHRGIGLGSYVMEKHFKKIEAQLAIERPAQLHVRYPRVDEEPVRSMWKKFFTLYDFEKYPKAPSDAHRSVRLHRSLG
ncbi:patatin-like phospholipase family protein [Singulisphaera sp. PoT]|uniref:patatin-like phospholipase family protein n=1 Tax=Singulisphaera sp. PoT TaxID=3411797 RepID=UPI003BF4B011